MSEEKIRPRGDYVLIRRGVAEEVSPGGIHLPANAQKRPDRGEVLAVGPGRTTDDGRLVSMDAKVGDVVLFGRYSGQPVDRDGHLLLVREGEIFGICE